MKPRIRVRHGVYDCRLPDFMETDVWGFGSTPAEAYRDWFAQQRKQWLHQVGRPTFTTEAAAVSAAQP